MSDYSTSAALSRPTGRESSAVATIRKVAKLLEEVQEAPGVKLEAEIARKVEEINDSVSRISKKKKKRKAELEKLHGLADVAKEKVRLLSWKTKMVTTARDSAKKLAEALLVVE